MKKIAALCLMIAIFLASVCAEDCESAKYYVNGLLLTEMSVEEIYDLEDTLVSALEKLFNGNIEGTAADESKGLYVINTKTKKYHYPWCYSALQIDLSKRCFCNCSFLDASKYKPCGSCNPKLEELQNEGIEIAEQATFVEQATLADYRVNERTLVEMSIPELYDFEDALVSALTVIFNRDMEETAAGELIGCYVINEKTKKFHYPWCYSALQIEPDKRSFERCAPSDLANPSRPDAQNYTPCGSCRPHVNG